MNVLTYNPALSAMNWIDATAEADLVLGIDCSRWQDDNSTPQRMDFDKAYAAGARFVFIKASQACWLDEDFIWNWVAAKDAGLYRGAYHYLDNSATGEKQGEFFCGLIEKDPGELPPVLDYEYRTAPPGLASANQWLNEVYWTLDISPILYTSPYYWKEYGGAQVGWTQYPLWIANYEVSSPTVPAPWTDWTFWQWTDKGDGIRYGAESHGLDMNWYNGSWSKFVEQFGELGTPVDPPPDCEGVRQDFIDEFMKKLEEMR